MQRSLKALTKTLVVAFASIAFVACGGGSGGGGGGGGATFLQLAAEPSYGMMGTTNSVTPFNIMTPSAVSLVGPNDFPSAQGGDINFIQFDFTTTVLASSVIGLGTGGNAGIVVRDSNGSLVSTFLDSTGAIDMTNAFATAGIAPATLRLYVEDPAAPGVPIALAPDKYSVSILPNNLKSGEGQSFCVVKDSGLCLNNTNCVYHFTLDGVNAPIGNMAAPLASGPTVALPLPAVAQIDDEIRLFFSDHVDFQSLVGFDANTGLINTTTKDPFVSLPFVMNAVGAPGANINISFTQPAPTVLPPNYGYICYMPNPFKDPTEVRIRFIDLTNVVGLDDPTGATTGGTPVFQNYALPASVWATARVGNNLLTPPTDTNPFSATFGSNLALPAKLSLPGSNSLGNNTLQITVFGPTNPNAADSSASNPAAMDGFVGLTDRSRRQLAQDIVVVRTMSTGPVFTNNPEPPDLHLVPNGRVLDGIDTAGVTVDGQGGSTLTGSIFRLAQPLDDVNTLEGISDMAFGAFVNPGNSVLNPPRRLNHAGALATKLLPQNLNNPAVPSPGVPFPPGGIPEASVLLPGPPPNVPPNPNQPLGVRLYVVDNVRGRVQVLNSNTFQSMGVLPGVSSPRGVGLAGSFLYVSNFDQNSITRVGINPAQTLTFHTVTGTTSVGPGPTSVSVQPGNEDVVVINSQANSISFVDVPTFKERVQLPVGMGSREVVVSGRWTGPGTTGAYQAYVTNQLSNSLSIYESDTPLITEPNGPDGKIITQFNGLVAPLYGCSTLFVGAFNGVGCQGALVPNSGGSTVTYVGFTAFVQGVPPGFMGPPSSRTFAAVIDYSSNSPTGPTDCAIDSFTVTIAQAVRILLAVYPAAGQVASIDFNNGAYYGAVSIPGTQIFGFVDQ